MQAESLPWVRILTASWELQICSETCQRTSTYQRTYKTSISHKLARSEQVLFHALSVVKESSSSGAEVFLVSSIFRTELNLPQILELWMLKSQKVALQSCSLIKVFSTLGEIISLDSWVWVITILVSLQSLSKPYRTRELLSLLSVTALSSHLARLCLWISSSQANWNLLEVNLKARKVQSVFILRTQLLVMEPTKALRNLTSQWTQQTTWQ